jgi:hypothetical protein
MAGSMPNPRTPSAILARISASVASRRARVLSCLGLLLVVGATGASARHVRATASYTFGGRITPADDGPLAGLRVVATDARGSYEALVDSSGVFVGAFSTPPTGRVTLRVFDESTAPRYHTSVVPLGPGAPTAPARIVLVPMRWRIRGGQFDGHEVNIDPLGAAMSSESQAFWRLTRRGRFAGRTVSWVADSFPLRVAFRHEPRDPAISPADSLEFWSTARGVERLLGRTLFRPASFAEVDSGGDGILVAINRGMGAAGRTFITYDQTGRIYEALVTVARREYLAETRIAAHELLHAIGLGHTRSWSSVMGPATGAHDSPTVDDVAYTQLYYAISELQRQREAPFGILEALGR